MVKLSILIPSVTSRTDNFYQTCIKEINRQAELFVGSVEILSIVDNKSMTLGEKRNQLIRIACGKYIVFLDDDDRVAPNYIERLIQEIDKCEMKADVINFTVNISINGGDYVPVFYSKEFQKDQNLPDRYLRIPNHIMCFKRDLIFQFPFKPILRGEDSDFSKRILSSIKTEVIIDDVLYFYDFNSETSETQNRLNSRAYN